MWVGWLWKEPVNYWSRCLNWRPFAFMHVRSRAVHWSTASSTSSVVTHLRCDGKHGMSLVATLLLSPTVKEFLKSANISQSYEQISSGTFFKVHSVSITVWYLVLVLEILFLVVDLAKDLLCKCNWIKEYMTLLSFGKDIIMLQQFAKVFLMRSLVQRVLPIVRFVKHLLNRSWEYVCVVKQKLRVCVWRNRSWEYVCVAKQKLRVCVRRNRSWEYVCGETEAESMCVAKQKLRVCVCGETEAESMCVARLGWIWKCWLAAVDRQAGSNDEAELYYKRSVELRPDVSCQLWTFICE